MANKYASREEREAAEFQDWGVTPPKVTPHGMPEDIRGNLTKLMPNKWRLSGNTLIGESEQGVIKQTIPTDYILTGSDMNGLPVFKKIVL